MNLVGDEGGVGKINMYIIYRYLGQGLYPFNDTNDYSIKEISSNVLHTSQTSASINKKKESRSIVPALRNINMIYLMNKARSSLGQGKSGTHPYENP
jgi:hypothetical protein